MVVTLETLRSRRREILRLANEHGAFNVRVFGSVARGQATERSDLDLLVDMAPGRSLLDLCALEDDLENLLGLPVDVGTTLHSRIRDRVLQDVVGL